MTKSPIHTFMIYLHPRFTEISLNDLRVTDVAHMIDYENVSFFHRIFFKETGCNPGQYRKENHFNPTLTKL